MKTNNLVYAFMLVIGITTANKMFAQQITSRQPMALHPERHKALQGFTTYVFMAPNNSYGYDVLKDGRLVYHAPAFSRVPVDGDAILTKKEQANAAAMISIDKIKKGKNPELSNAELQKIITHQ